MRPARHGTLLNPLLQALRRGLSCVHPLGTGTYGSVTKCWVRGHGLVALKCSLISNDTLRAEAELNRRIPPHPCIAQVGALQHSLSAQEGMLGFSCVAQLEAHLHTASAPASRLTWH